MSELKAHTIYTPMDDVAHDEKGKILEGQEVYLKSEADKVIAEKDKEIAELKAACVNTDNSAVIENMAAELEKLRPMETALELAEADNKGYLARIKTMEAKNRRLERALWLVRAEIAHVTTLHWNVYCYQNNCIYFRDFIPERCNPFRSLPKKTAMEWSDLWESIETKCRAKAEQYK